MTKITIEISEEEIAGLESCVEAAEADGYKEDSAWKTLRKIREAFQQSVQPTPPTALVCECGSLYGVHEEFCPKYKSAGG